MNYPLSISFVIVNNKIWNAVKDLGSELVLHNTLLHYKRTGYVKYIDCDDQQERLVFWKRVIQKEHVTQIEIYNKNNSIDNDQYWYVTLYIAVGSPDYIDLTFITESAAKEAYNNLMTYLYP